MAVVFAFSAFVIGPAVTGGSDSTTTSRSTPARTAPDSGPPGASDSEHEEHHR